MEYKKRLQYVQKMHEGQVHANKVPVSHHLERVSARLKQLFEIYSEGNEVDRKDIYLAALGHDILEDTPATKEDILTVFGERQYSIIFGMTNEWGDDNVLPYVKKVSIAEEGVRLIKLSDLLDNITSVTYNIAVLKPEWVDRFFLPVVTPMKDAVLETEFTLYPQTAQQLKLMMKLAYNTLLLERARF
jgi:(p)ppGpp synthase/HD superfamily hydrolase